MFWIFCSFGKKLFNINPTLHQHKNTPKKQTSKKPQWNKQANKQTKINKKNPQRILFSNIWTPLWESRKIFSCVYPYIIFIPLSVFISPWWSITQHSRNRSGCEATGAESTEFAVCTSVAVPLDFCGPWSECPLVTEE